MKIKRKRKKIDSIFDHQLVKTSQSKKKSLSYRIVSAQAKYLSPNWLTLKRFFLCLSSVLLTHFFSIDLHKCSLVEEFSKSFWYERFFIMLSFCFILFYFSVDYPHPQILRFFMLYEFVIRFFFLYAIWIQERCVNC